MFVYIEFISRRATVSLTAFHQVLGGAQRSWESEFGADRLLLNLARTWRLGPEPEYLCIWYMPDGGLERIDEWEQIFRSGAADPNEQQFQLAGRIDRAGCYEPLLEPATVVGSYYYAEYLDFSPGASRDDVRGFFDDRRTRRSDVELVLLVDRIGKLAPDPRCLAFWRLPAWKALDGVGRDLEGVENPVRLLTSALYANFGAEIL